MQPKMSRFIQEWLVKQELRDAAEQLGQPHGALPDQHGVLQGKTTSLHPARERKITLQSPLRFPAGAHAPLL